MPKIIIVDDEDRVIGHKERVGVGSDDIYRVSALWLTNSRGQILLAQRKLTKKHDPGKWGPAVAGTVEEGETYLSNIVKEIQEEIGLAIAHPTESVKRRMDLSGYHYFVQWYTAVVDADTTNIVIQEDEVEQIAWLSPEELRQAIETDSDKYLPSVEWALSNL